MSQYLFENFLTPSEIAEIYDEFMNTPRTSENDNTFVNNRDTYLTEAFYNLPSTLKYMPKFQAAMEAIYGKNIQFANTFTRLYKNGSFLKPHVDRDGLDITISLCLRRDVAWPIHVSPKFIDDNWRNDDDYNKDAYTKESAAFDLHPGDFAHCYGRKNPHWRPKLECGENQHNAYVFLHWTIV